jgi:hypothetical protein
MFWGAGLFGFPRMLLYTVVGYRVFRGKLEPATDHLQGPGNAHLTVGGSPHPAE